MKKAEVVQEQVTKEQIEIWKKQYGGAFRLYAEDGKTAIIRDPLYSLPIMKKAAAALDKSMNDYIRSILADCFLTGDEELKNVEGYAEGLEAQVLDLLEMPDISVELKGGKYIINCEGHTVEVRQALRRDIQMADKKNPKKVPYESNIALLSIIGISGVEEVKKNTKALIGVLSVLDDVRKKVHVSVEKL